MIVLALSSGTSVDGIDIALAEIAPDPGDAAALTLRPLLETAVDLSEGLREDILAALPPAGTTTGQVCRIDTLLGQELATAASSVVASLPADRRPSLVVSHGQTLYHWVEGAQVHGTLQLGQPAWIAEATGLPVLSDVRVADVAAGGQGAPLAGLMDVLLLADRDRPAAGLNLGGIANVTVVPPAPAAPVAMDTGPANALLDAAVRRATGGREHLDRDGRLAAAGTVHEGLLAALLDEPYYRLPAPRTTGKELFHSGYLQEHLTRTGTSDLSPEDLLATLVELTATTVAAALAPHGVSEVLASGGGTRNPVLLDRLAHHLGPARLTTTAELGLDPDAKEAYLFALLGYLSWHGLPGTHPACTGARQARVAGRLTPGTGPLTLPPPATTAPRALRVLTPRP